MIALSVALAVAASLAPPLDTDVRYRIVDITRGKPEDTRVTTDMTLRFRRDGARLIAAGRTDAVAVRAPAPIRARLVALFGPLIGATTQAEVAPDGAIGALVDPEPSWRAFMASQRAFLARIEATPGFTPEQRILGRDAVRARLDPARRDDVLRPGLAQLLAPPLPSLAPGETRRISGNARGIPADSVVTLVAAAAAWLDYRIETVTVAGAETDARFAEVTSLRIDRLTGLLGTAHGRRELRQAGKTPIVISTHDVERVETR